MMRRALLVLAIAVTGLSAGLSSGEQERPVIEVLSGSDGQVCVQVYLDEFAPVICVPVPN